MAKQKSVLWTGDRNTSNTINLHLSLQGWSRKLKKKSHKFWKLLIIKGTGNTFKTSGAGTRIYPSADVAVAMFSHVLPPPYNHIQIPSCKQLYVSLRLWLFFRKSLNPGKIPFLIPTRTKGICDLCHYLLLSSLQTSALRSALNSAGL